VISYKISDEIKKKLKEEEEKEDKKTSETSEEKDVNTNSNTNSNSNVKQENKTEIATVKEESLDTNKNSKDISDKNISEIVDDLNEIKNKYKSLDFVDAPETLGLEKIEIKEYSDDDINKLAKDSLAQKYNLKTTNTNESFKNKIDDIIKNNKDLSIQNEYNVEKVNNYYDQSIKETENQALKRGLARSSIIISEISNIEGSRAKELSNILQNLQNSIFENEVKIQNLNQQKEQALSNLDIEYALELEEKIKDLTDDYNKKKEEAIKFNNNVEKLEADYKLNLDKQKLDKKKQTLALKEKYGEDIYQNEIQENQYSYLKNYFDTLDPKYALSIFLTNKDLKNILGDNYAKMYKYLSARF